MIDPKTLVDVSDLPQWLQDVAARPVQGRRAVAVPNAQDDQENIMPEHKDISQKVLDTEPTPSRTVSFEAQSTPKTNLPEGEVKTFGGPKPSGFQPNILVLSLAVLAALLIVWLLLTLL